MRRLRLLFLVPAAALALVAASGASAVPYRPYLGVLPFAKISAAAAKRAQSVPVCPNGQVCFTPAQLKQLYDFPTGRGAPTGAGQTILIITAFGSPTIEADLKQFSAENGLPDPPGFTIVRQQTPVTDATAGQVEDWIVETTLDVQYAHAIAPGAEIVLAVADTEDSQNLAQVAREVLPRYPRAIVSQSWGGDEAGPNSDPEAMQTLDALYRRQVLRGGTVLASAGDYGATNLTFAVPMAGYPASSPYVLSVGGTMGDPAPGGLWNNGRYGGEQVWNEIFYGPDGSPVDAGATGGAPSRVYKAPFWQRGITGETMRAQPDVAYNAAFDGGVVIAISAFPGIGHGVVGGTSAGTPQWAGIIALANELRGKQGRRPLGLAAQQLYSIARDRKDYRQDFHDIVTGNNAYAGDLFGLPGFEAKPGYDLATGLGTPVVSKLLKDLAKSDVRGYDGNDDD